MASTAVEVVIALTAKDAASAAINNVTGKFKDLGSVAKLAVVGVAALATAGSALLGGLTKLAQESAKTAGEVNKLKRETGLGAVEASKFLAIGNRMGLSVDDLSKSFGTFSKSVDNNAKAISDNHITIVKAKGGQVDFEKTLGGVADRFKNMPDGVAKTSLAMELFGKSGKDMLPLLNQGSAGLKAMGDTAERLGFVFDEKALAAAKRYSVAQKDMSDAVEGLKNRIGMAFLPILADMSQAMLGIATAVLPHLTRGFDVLSGFVRTAIGVVKEIIEVATRSRPEAGGLLASIISPEKASAFMGLVATVSLTFNHFWESTIKPALEWIWRNAPIIWDMLSKAIEKAWTAAKPHLEALVKQLENARTRFDALPDPVKKWAMETTLAVGVIKVLGIDDMIMGWVSAIGNFASGIGATIVAMKTLGVAVVFAGAIIAAFAVAAVGAVVYIANNLAELEDAWTMLSLMFKLQFARVVDFLWNAWRGFVLFFIGKINELISNVNGLIEGMNRIPGVNIPLIARIEVDIPNANNAENVMDDIARYRVARVQVQFLIPPMPTFGVQGAYQHGTPSVPRTGLALVHKGERIIPAHQNKPGGGGWGGGEIHTHVYLNGHEIATAVGDVFTQQRRMQGLSS